VLHNIHKAACRTYSPHVICEHNIRNSCAICYPKRLCEHNIHKSSCKIYTPSLTCTHNIQKSKCKDCSPHLRFEHDKLKFECRICSPNLLCMHDELKHRCKICTPALICQHHICIKVGVWHSTLVLNACTINSKGNVQVVTDLQYVNQEKNHTILYLGSEAIKHCGFCTHCFANIFLTILNQKVFKTKVKG